MRASHFSKIGFIFCLLLLVQTTSSCASNLEPVGINQHVSYKTLFKIIYKNLLSRKDIPAEYRDILDPGPPDSEVLIKNDNYFVYVASENWVVMVVLVNDDGSYQDAKFFIAKEGFAIDWDSGLEIILHKHPGTGMFMNEKKLVSVEDGKLKIKDVETE